MNREIQDKIPVFSFLMMCVVVLYHCLIPEELYQVTGIDSLLNTSVTSFLGVFCALALRWFFTITGFLLFRKLGFHTFGQKLKNRVYSLLIPYILWCGIYILKSILQGNHWTLYNAVSQVFFFRKWPPLPAFWYVYAVFLLALLSPLVLLIFRNRQFGALFVIFWSIFASYCLKSSFLLTRRLSYYYITNIFVYSTAYFIGAFYGSIYSEEDCDKNLQNLKYLVLFFIISQLLDSGIPGLFEMVAGSSIPILMLFLLPVPNSFKNLRLYSTSFLMFATHQPLISISTGFIYRLLFLVPGLIPIAGLIGRLLCLCFVCTANYFLFYIMKRFTPRTLRLLTGGRAQ